MCYPISLDESFNSVQDIYVFFRREFDKLCVKHTHTIPSKSWPPDYILQFLADRSGGQFIYASTVIKFIDNEDCWPTDQLEIVLNTSRLSMPSTEQPFHTLDMLYQQILSTCRNRSLLLRILGCILITQKPLCAVDIEHLLSLRKGDVGLTLRRIHSLLRVPREQSESIHVYHKSLPDFLFNSHRAGEYYMEHDLCHLDFARCCLCILSSPPGSW
jgi:hypothetical protein